MLLATLFLVVACDPNQGSSARLEGCYHEASLSLLLNANRIDPLEVRWANGVEEICRYSDDRLSIHHPDKPDVICSPNELCFDFPVEVLDSKPPNELTTVVFGTEKMLVWSEVSLSTKLSEMDHVWAIEMLSRYGGASKLVDGTELSLVSPAQMFVNGERVAFDQKKCLVMRDIHPPHQTLCLFEQNDSGYAHVGKWIRVRRAGDTGLDARRAYGMDGGSRSYMNLGTSTGVE